MSDEQKFEEVLAEDRRNEKAVSRRMLVAWFAAVAVMVIWFVFEKVSG